MLLSTYCIVPSRYLVKRGDACCLAAALHSLVVLLWHFMLYLVEPAALTLSSSATVLMFSGPTSRTRAILAGMSFGGPFRKKIFYNNLGLPEWTWHLIVLCVFWHDGVSCDYRRWCLSLATAWMYIVDTDSSLGRHTHISRVLWE